MVPVWGPDMARVGQEPHPEEGAGAQVEEGPGRRFGPIRVCAQGFGVPPGPELFNQGVFCCQSDEFGIAR